MAAQTTFITITFVVIFPVAVKTRLRLAAEQESSRACWPHAHDASLPLTFRRK